MSHRSILALLAALAGVTALAPASADAKTKWLCRPGLKSNPCTPKLDTAVFSSWSTQSGTQTPKRVAKPKVDCFYVYPTVSNQEGPLADLTVDPELKSIALYQTARYSQQCKVYAPVYHQITVPALQSGKYTAANAAVAYKDVKAAWTEYLKRFNKGRPFILIGHSQGTFHLKQLLHEKIENKAKLRKRMVSAILLGGNVTVKKGSDVGGSFDKVKACRSATQLGCVMAFSTFDEPVPTSALFGRTTTAGQEVLCTNPAALGGGKAPLGAIFPSAPCAPGALVASGIQLLDLKMPTASSSWIQVDDAVDGQCSNTDG